MSGSIMNPNRKHQHMANHKSASSKRKTRETTRRREAGAANLAVAERECDEPDTERPYHHRAIPPGENERERLQAVLAAKNPLLEAARVLLRAQADLPERITADTATVLREVLRQEVEVFNRLCTKANIREDHMIGARYCLCTALDEFSMLALSDSTDRNGVNFWSQSPLAIQFHSDGDGGNKIFLLIGRLMAEPEEHRDLLVVIYRILSFGFEGRYRYSPQKNQILLTLRTRIYEQIMRGRDPAPQTLSLHLKPHEVKRGFSLLDIPVWKTVSVLSLVLLAMYGYFRYELVRKSADVRRQIADVARVLLMPQGAVQAETGP